MAQRPLVWAIGIAFAVGYGAMNFGAHLAEMAGDDAPAAALSMPAEGVASTPAQPGGNPTLTVSADYRGHFVVHPEIDGYRVGMLVDTGASLIALRAEDARALGLQPSAADYKVLLRTANGMVRGARMNLREVRLGAILVRNVEAVVMPAGALSMSLLGNSFLGRLRGYEVQTGRMLLRG